MDHGHLFSGYTAEGNENPALVTLVFQKEAGFNELVPIHDKMLMSPILYRFYIGKHSYSEFTQAMTMTFPENSYLLHTSLSFCSYFLVSSSVMFPEPWRG